MKLAERLLREMSSRPKDVWIFNRIDIENSREASMFPEVRISLNLEGFRPHRDPVSVFFNAVGYLLSGNFVSLNGKKFGVKEVGTFITNNWATLSLNLEPVGAMPNVSLPELKIGPWIEDEA